MVIFCHIAIFLQCFSLNQEFYTVYLYTIRFLSRILLHSINFTCIFLGETFLSKSCIVLGTVDSTIKNYLPLVDTPVRAGFPSPADDYLEAKLDLTDHLVKHPSATYYIKAQGESMINYGIFSGDLLVVDRSLVPQIEDIVVAAVDGELTCKCLGLIDGQHYLLSGNELYPPISLAGKEVHIWGVVIHTIHSLRKRGHA